MLFFTRKHKKSYKSTQQLIQLYIYVSLFARSDTLDVVGSAVQDLDEVTASFLDTSLHGWDAFGVTFHSMGGNAESELHPALSSLNLVSSSRHARHLHVHAFFSEVVGLRDGVAQSGNDDKSEDEKFHHFDVRRSCLED